MSFFVSDSLKDVISEEDLVADSPIKIKEAQTDLILRLECNDSLLNFKSPEINFSKSNNVKIKIFAGTDDLCELLPLQDKFINYSIIVDTKQYIPGEGTLKIKSLETNKDNYVTCKIDIIK